MQQLTDISNAILTMGSREIAALTGKHHFHVTTDIEKMLLELGEDATAFRGIYFDSMNRKQTEYLLDRELTETLLTGYSAKLRRAVIARWHELEEKQAAPMAPAELSRMDILTLAMESEKGRLLAVEQLAIAAPKADALDRIAGVDGSMCITDAAKAIKLQPKRLFAWMHANNWIYKRAGSSKWVACQARLKSAHLDCEYVTVVRPDGTEKNVPNVLVTAKGLAKLAEVAA